MRVYAPEMMGECARADTLFKNANFLHDIAVEFKEEVKNKTPHEVGRGESVVGGIVWAREPTACVPGHFIAYARTPTGRWRRFDDDIPAVVVVEREALDALKRAVLLVRGAESAPPRQLRGRAEAFESPLAHRHSSIRRAPVCVLRSPRAIARAYS